MDCTQGLSISDQQLSYRLYSNAVKLSIVFLICGELWYTFTETSSVDEVVTSINPTLRQLITLYRYKNMMDNKEIYKTLATTMKHEYFDLSTPKRKELVNFWSHKNERFLKLVLILGNCTLAAWYIYPLVDELEYNLIVGIRVPYNYQSPLMYALTYTVMVMVFGYMAHYVMVSDLIMQAHLIHLLCQFMVLSDCFENLLTDCQNGFEGIEKSYLMYNRKFADKYTRMLGNLVTQHQYIVSHTMKLRNTLQGSLLGQLIASGTIMCFVGYQATTTITENFAKGVMSLFFLGYNMFTFYIICLWCEEISIKSQNISQAIYSSGWESGMAMIPGVKSTMMLVIARANKPLVFTAGGMYDLSLESYSALVKTSYSALTVLLRFRH